MNLHARQGQDADTENEHADTGQGREGGRDRRLGFQYRLPSVQSRQLVGLLHTAGSSAQVGLLYTTGSSAQVGLLYTAGSSALVGPAVYHRGLSPTLCDDLGGWDLGECGRRSGREGIYLYI